MIDQGATLADVRSWRIHRGAHRPSTWRDNAEFPSPGNTVGLEIIVVDSADGGQRLSLSKMHQRCVGKVHGMVAVLVHEPIQGRQVGVGYRQNKNGPRANEPPRRFDIMGVIAEKMEEFGEDGRRCGQGQAKRIEGRNTPRVPAILPIQNGKHRSGINQTVGAHVALEFFDEPALWPALPGRDLHRSAFRNTVELRSVNVAAARPPR